MLEKELEKKLVDKVRQLGGRAYKFISPGNSGVPDRLVVLPKGRVYFVEMKRPGGRTRKLQERQIKFLNSLEHNTAIIDSKAKLESFLGGLDAKANI